MLAPGALARFLAYKGSITVNGVSLTVNRVDDVADGLRVRHQPDPAHAAEHDPRLLKVGDCVNLEIDLIARYVERMLSPSTDRLPQAGSGIAHCGAARGAARRFAQGA